MRPLTDTSPLRPGDPASGTLPPGSTTGDPAYTPGRPFPTDLGGSPATPFGSQDRPFAGGVPYLDGIEYAIPSASWTRVRDACLRRGKCTVYHVFSMNDKQFQTAVSSVKVPDTLYHVGRDSFNPDAWRDLHEYLEAIDCWNLFCAILSGNFRVVLDGLESLSLGGNLVGRILEAAPTSVLVGHSKITASLSRWHGSHVFESPTLLWATLASVVLRDRIIRPLILAAINAEAKKFLRSTFPRENGIFPTYIAALHSWRFKEEDVWSALTDLDKQLCSKKPGDKSIRD